jgi:hypothetical protein
MRQQNQLGIGEQYILEDCCAGWWSKKVSFDSERLQITAFAEGFGFVESGVASVGFRRIP